MQFDKKDLIQKIIEKFIGSHAFLNNENIKSHVYCLLYLQCVACCKSFDKESQNQEACCEARRFAKNVKRLSKDEQKEFFEFVDKKDSSLFSKCNVFFKYGYFDPILSSWNLRSFHEKMKADEAKREYENLCEKKYEIFEKELSMAKNNYFFAMLSKDGLQKIEMNDIFKKDFTVFMEYCFGKSRVSLKSSLNQWNVQLKVIQGIYKLVEKMNDEKIKEEFSKKGLSFFKSKNKLIQSKIEELIRKKRKENDDDDLLFQLLYLQLQVCNNLFKEEDFEAKSEENSSLTNQFKENIDKLLEKDQVCFLVSLFFTGTTNIAEEKCNQLWQQCLFMVMPKVFSNQKKIMENVKNKASGFMPYLLKEGILQEMFSGVKACNLENVAEQSFKELCYFLEICFLKIEEEVLYDDCLIEFRQFLNEQFFNKKEIRGCEKRAKVVLDLVYALFRNKRITVLTKVTCSDYQIISILANTILTNKEFELKEETKKLLEKLIRENVGNDIKNITSKKQIADVQSNIEPAVDITEYNKNILSELESIKNTYFKSQEAKILKEIEQLPQDSDSFSQFNEEIGDSNINSSKEKEEITEQAENEFGCSVISDESRIFENLEKFRKMTTKKGCGLAGLFSLGSIVSIFPALIGLKQLEEKWFVLQFKKYFPKIYEFLYRHNHIFLLGTGLLFCFLGKRFFRGWHNKKIEELDQEVVLNMEAGSNEMEPVKKTRAGKLWAALLEKYPEQVKRSAFLAGDSATQSRFVETNDSYNIHSFVNTELKAALQEVKMKNKTVEMVKVVFHEKKGKECDWPGFTRCLNEALRGGLVLSEQPMEREK